MADNNRLSGTGPVPPDGSGLAVLPTPERLTVEQALGRAGNMNLAGKIDRLYVLVIGPDGSFHSFTSNMTVPEANLMLDIAKVRLVPKI